MNYYTIPPSKKLEGLVRFFWVFESGKLNEPYIYRSMADSCTELVFHYRSTFDELSACGQKNTSFLSGVHAQTMNYSRFITSESFGIFGAYLYPFAVRQLLGISPGELIDHAPDLHAVLGREGKELEEQIMLAPNNSTRCRILTRFLENRLCKSSEITHPALLAITYIIHSKKLHTVRELADHFNLSERQFERKFKEYSGFNPKLFMRIVRFGEACNHYKDYNNKSLTEIAYECGYYDQSHFIKDFKTFSGYQPAEYFSGNAEGTEWRETEQFFSD